MPRAKAPREHGTTRGYRQHVTDKTVPCEWCCRAWADKSDRDRDRGKCARGLGWPLEASRG